MDARYSKTTRRSASRRRSTSRLNRPRSRDMDELLYAKMSTTSPTPKSRKLDQRRDERPQQLGRDDRSTREGPKKFTIARAYSSIASAALAIVFLLYFSGSWTGAARSQICRIPLLGHTTFCSPTEGISETHFNRLVAQEAGFVALHELATNAALLPAMLWEGHRSFQQLAFTVEMFHANSSGQLGPIASGLSKISSRVSVSLVHSILSMNTLTKHIPSAHLNAERYFEKTSALEKGFEKLLISLGLLTDDVRPERDLASIFIGITTEIDRYIELTTEESREAGPDLKKLKTLVEAIALGWMKNDGVGDVNEKTARSLSLSFWQWLRSLYEDEDNHQTTNELMHLARLGDLGLDSTWKQLLHHHNSTVPNFDERTELAAQYYRTILMALESASMITFKLQQIREEILVLRETARAEIAEEGVSLSSTKEALRASSRYLKRKSKLLNARQKRDWDVFERARKGELPLTRAKEEEPPKAVE
ncbi:hypothetical protein TI39_contig900g00003 [Zymoseptoria brevis]|uniref:Uncharacterized protein n=1 Tax=Zymoseptoria brevis TaxID=1047168 RepID=A0A0F4GI84_9PEZI|nr:hypothetical protein TI39_contig900g00003 [Zymoseptoria brevis]